MTTETFNEKYSKLDRPQLIALAGLMCLGAAFVFKETFALVAAPAAFCA